MADRLQQAVHHTISHQRRAGGLCPVNSRGHCACVTNIHSIPRGEEKMKRNPTNRWEVPRSSPRWAGNLRQRGDTRTHLTGCCKLHSVKGDSARGTEHYKCQGHWTFKNAMDTLDNCGNQSQCLDQVRSGESLWVLSCGPHSRLELGLPYLFF